MAETIRQAALYSCIMQRLRPRIAQRQTYPWIHSRFWRETVASSIEVRLTFAYNNLVLYGILRYSTTPSAHIYIYVCADCVAI
jgi:hypothetical protein